MVPAVPSDHHILKYKQIIAQKEYGEFQIFMWILQVNYKNHSYICMRFYLICLMYIIYLRIYDFSIYKNDVSSNFVVSSHKKLKTVIHKPISYLDLGVGLNFGHSSPWFLLGPAQNVTSITQQLGGLGPLLTQVLSVKIEQSKFESPLVIGG